MLFSMLLQSSLYFATLSWFIYHLNSVLFCYSGALVVCRGEASRDRIGQPAPRPSPVAASHSTSHRGNESAFPPKKLSKSQNAFPKAIAVVPLFVATLNSFHPL